MVQFQYDPVKFGWSKVNPPEYKVNFTPDAFNDLTKLTLTDEFIQQTAEQLVGAEDSAPRFLVFPNITQFTTDAEQIKRVQESLSKGVFNYLNQTQNYFKLPENRLKSIGNRWHHFTSRIPDKGASIVNKFINAIDFTKGDKAESGEKVYGANLKGLKTFHPMHFDFPYGLVSISYGPFKNIEGGFPQISDLRQLLRDKNSKRSVRRTVPFLKVLNPFTNKKLMKDYTLVLDDLDYENGRPIVMFINARDSKGGVLHGVSPIKQTGEGEAQRDLYYLSNLSGEEKQYWS